MLKHIEDIEPIDDRLMTMTLKGVLKTTIITTHIPQAESREQDKEEAYKKLDIEIKKNLKDD